MDLIVRPHDLNPGDSGEVLSLSPSDAGWEFIGFKVYRLQPGEYWSFENHGVESALVLLGGTCDVTSNVGSWDAIGTRQHVFDGLPTALYLPLGAKYTVAAKTPLEFAIATSKATDVHPAQLIAPSDIEVEIRGDGNAKRQINKILKPEFAADKLLVVEVFTPSGNWSSYPPHKHDVHDMPNEADLEEIYFYKVDKPEGFAIQKVYTDDRRLDETLTVKDGELVLIPEGYHPVVAPPGYNVYYLNILAGSARSMAASDDPAYAWVRDTWAQHESVPMFA
jgi:5-deoxy-glucuronate isomerase